MSRADELREKIAKLKQWQARCAAKAMSLEIIDPQRCALYDEFAETAEKEADALYDELREEEDEGGDRFLREYIADVSWGRRG